MTAERKVYEAKVGAIRCVLMARGGALALFEAKTRNELIRNALTAGGVFWLRAFLPKRFSQYAYRLGYRVSKKWKDQKERHLGVVVPYIGGTPPGGGRVMPTWSQRNGEKMITAALNGANVKATATASVASLVFRVPFGHPLQADHAAWFRAMPSWEIQRVAEVTAKALDELTTTAFMEGRGVRGDSRGTGAPTQVRVTGAGDPRQTGAAAPRRAA